MHTVGPFTPHIIHCVHSVNTGTQFVHKSAVKTPSFSSFHDAASSSFGHFHRRSDQNPNSLSAPQKSRFHLGSIVESEQGDGDDNKTNDEGASVELARMGEGMEVDSGDDDDDWDLSKYGMSESDDEDYRDEVVKINDDDVELNVLSTGDYFGEMAILTECKRTASVASVGYGELLLLTRSDVEVLTGMFPNFTSALMAFAPDKIKGGHATTKLLQSE